MLTSTGGKRRIANEAYLRDTTAEWDWKPCGMEAFEDCRNSAWKFVYSTLGNKFDWVVLPQDQTKTYVVVQNLKYVLSRHNSSLPLYFGNGQSVDSSWNLIDAPGMLKITTHINV